MAQPPRFGARRKELERKVQDAVASLLADPQRIEQQIEARIERDAMRNPDEEAAMWARRLEDIAKARGRYQDQQAAEYMNGRRHGGSPKQPRIGSDGSRS